MQYEHITVPAAGGMIRINADRTLSVPDQPIIPFIEGDGIGIDVTPAMQRVVDAAVAKAYGPRRRIHSRRRPCRPCASSWSRSKDRSAPRSAAGCAR
jgi:hypothetical protein